MLPGGIRTHELSRQAAADLRLRPARPLRPTGHSYKVHYNNINSPLDATMVILLKISISSTCFGRQFRPFSGALDCVYSLWYKAPTMLPAGIVCALYHSLPEDGRNCPSKHVELIEIVNKIIIVASSWLFVLVYRLWAFYSFVPQCS